MNFNTIVSAYIKNAVYDRFIPALAASMLAVSVDGLTLTIDLRTNIYFSDDKNYRS
ncbi:MAG: hypothetical protein LBB22_02680 [Treponema sp.]|nr:hypothetical protein [Treponema sp.]